jgi:sarcosine oxidase, subunit beta
MRHGIYIDTINGSYFRPHHDDLTLAGLGSLSPEEETNPDSFREENDKSFVETARKRLGARLPALAQAQYVRGHAGIYDVTPDSRPVLGRVPEVSGLFVAAGFSGTGFKTSPAVGGSMAELILGGRAKTVNISAFSFDRIVNHDLIHPTDEYAMAEFGHTL